ncbi:hypothetical protein Tco_0533544 [Tanacetum coccineum]
MSPLTLKTCHNWSLALHLAFFLAILADPAFDWLPVFTLDLKSVSVKSMNEGFTLSRNVGSFPLLHFVIINSNNGYYKWFGVGNRDVNDYYPRLPDKLHHMLVSFPSTLFQVVFSFSFSFSCLEFLKLKKFELFCCLNLFGCLNFLFIEDYAVEEKGMASDDSSFYSNISSTVRGFMDDIGIGMVKDSLS